jgi:hypothetical protein
VEPLKKSAISNNIYDASSTGLTKFLKDVKMSASFSKCLNGMMSKATSKQILYHESKKPVSILSGEGWAKCYKTNEEGKEYT